MLIARYLKNDRIRLSMQTPPLDEDEAEALGDRAAREPTATVVPQRDEVAGRTRELERQILSHWLLIIASRRPTK